MSHMKREHSNDHLYMCAVCGDGFKYSRQLDVHMYSHTGEKNHLCDLCGKSFISKVGMKKHRWKHTAPRSHVCTVCGKGFINSYRLKRHKPLHDKIITPNKVETQIILPKQYASETPPETLMQNTNQVTEQVISMSMGGTDDSGIIPDMSYGTEDNQYFML